MLQCCVCLSPSLSSPVTLCIVIKRCVLEQKLPLTAYRKSYLGNRWFELCSKVVSRSLRHIRHWMSRKPSRDKGLVPKKMAYGWIIKWSQDRWRHVAPKGQTRDPNTLRAQYLENSCRYNLAIIANF